MRSSFLKYQEFVSLNESKTSARRRFLDSGKLDQKTFNELVNIDPSPTYKYLEKLVSYYLEGASISTLQSQIKTYDELVKRNLIKSKDINQLDYNQFKQELESGSSVLTSREEHKEKEEGVTVLLDNDFFRVVVPDTEESSCRYGAGTKWCTSATKSENYFKSYRYKNGVTLYYIFDKSKDSSDPIQQIAVAVYPDGKQEVFNTLDKTISFSDIPKELFKYFPESEFKPRDVSDKVDPFDKYRLDKSKATLNPDGTYDYDGDVNLSFAKLTELPIKFKNVKGDFNCSHNQLKSLEGAPKSVGGGFWCSDNKLESLEGAPKSVGGGFDCSYNGLESLEGAPKSVGGGFDCSYNGLESLEGAPSVVSGDFYCNNNNLENLKGSPESVGGSFDCRHNQLESLEGSPRSVGGDFRCYDNQLVSLEGAPKSVSGDFYCNNNKLVSLEGAPKSVKGDFDCQNNPDLKSLNGIGEVKGKIYSDIR